MSSTDQRSEIESLLAELDETDLETLSEEKILELRRKLNPYGRTIEGSNACLNFSITNIAQKYERNLMITAFVGFLHRMCDEWRVPAGVPIIPVYEYLDNPSELDTPEAVIKMKDEKAAQEFEDNRQMMQKRIVVKEFLEEFLQYNPDSHVRSAYRPNPSDKKRNIIDTMAGRLAVDHLMTTDRDFRTREELSLVGKATKKVAKIIRGKDGQTRTIYRDVPADQPEQPTKSTAWRGAPAVANAPEGTPDATVAANTREFIPPHDTFGRFRRYLESNYEALREATDELYCEKSDFEYAINPYSWHTGVANGMTAEDQAEAFKKKHRGEVIAEVFTAHSGKWNFYGPFKQVRESVNYYNENTQILEEMIKQNERDEKLGRDLMVNRVKHAKAKNIAEQGPDDPAFTKWRRGNRDLQQMGAEHIGDMASEECPDDAVEVDVWKASRGGRELKKTKFFTAAQAPNLNGGGAE